MVWLPVVVSSNCISVRAGAPLSRGVTLIGCPASRGGNLYLGAGNSHAVRGQRIGRWQVHRVTRPYVKRRAVPGARHNAVLQLSFAQRASLVRAHTLDRVVLARYINDHHALSV